MNKILGSQNFVSGAANHVFGGNNVVINSLDGLDFSDF